MGKVQSSKARSKDSAAEVGEKNILSLPQMSTAKRKTFETEYIKDKLPYECLIMLTQTQPVTVPSGKTKRENVVLQCVIKKINEYSLLVTVLPNRDLDETLPWSMVKKIIPINTYDKSARHTEVEGPAESAGAQ